MQLTQDPVRPLDEHGFLVLPDVFTAEEVELIRDKVPAMVAERGPENPREACKEKVRSILSLHQSQRTPLVRAHGALQFGCSAVPVPGDLDSAQAHGLRLGVSELITRGMGTPSSSASEASWPMWPKKSPQAGNFLQVQPTQFVGCAVASRSALPESINRYLHP